MNPKIKKANIAAGVIGILAGITLFAMGITVAVICEDYQHYPWRIDSDSLRLIYQMSGFIFLLGMSFGTIMILGGILLILHSIRLIVSSKNQKNDFTFKSYESIGIELERFYDLYTKGILTEEEFTIQKQKILGYKAEDLTSIKNNIDYK